MGKKKAAIYRMFDGECFYCKKKIPYQLATIEHIVPVSKGGTNKSYNLAICCAKVNNLRGNKPTKAAKDYLKQCPLADHEEKDLRHLKIDIVTGSIEENNDEEDRTNDD